MEGNYGQGDMSQPRDRTVVATWTRVVEADVLVLRMEHVWGRGLQRSIYTHLLVQIYLSTRAAERLPRICTVLCQNAASMNVLSAKTTDAILSSVRCPDARTTFHRPTFPRTSTRIFRFISAAQVRRCEQKKNRLNCRQRRDELFIFLSHVKTRTDRYCRFSNSAQGTASEL